jgi:hypothetical protein
MKSTTVYLNNLGSTKVDGRIAFKLKLLPTARGCIISRNFTFLDEESILYERRTEVTEIYEIH